MRTNKASQKSPAPGATIRFKPADGYWYDGTYSEDGEYTYENGQVASKDTVEAWYNVKPAADQYECAAVASPVKVSASPTVDKVEPTVDRGGFDLDKPSDTDGDGWAIFNSVRTIYGLPALPVPPTAVSNSLSTV